LLTSPLINATIKSKAGEHTKGRTTYGEAVTHAVALTIRMPMATCDKHPFDDAVDTCRTCERVFCPSCLVYAFGPNKPPLCVPCALAAAGVRKMPRRSGRIFAFG
jgi:hypothetical protein